MHDALSRLPKTERDKLKSVRQPKFVEPMRATLVHEHFSDPSWIFERKLDGQRCLLHKKGNTATLYSRNQRKQGSVFPEIKNAVSSTPGNFILDSEIVTFAGNLTSFKHLQNRIHVENPDSSLVAETPVLAYVFDIIFFEGYDLCDLPLRQRKKVLRHAFTLRDPLRILPYRNKTGERYLSQACNKGWEGLIAKNASAGYQHSRSKQWLKLKCGNRQELVIGGFTDPEGERVGFGALLLGYYEGESFLYAGRVGAGFDDDFLKTFRKKLNRIERKTPPFADIDSGDKTTHWVRPEYVGEIGFTEWTGEGRLRHPRFLGLRTDKNPDSVRKEEPS